MPLEVLDKAFDPFFTTKPIGQGTGLGLSMIYGFAKQSGGHVRIDSEPGKGTTVVLFLPRHYGDTPSAENTRAVRAQSARSGEVVLLVEDDPSVRILVTEVLRDLGYETLLARDGREAADLLSSQQRIDLLITDVGLPGMNGREVAEIGRRTRPHLKVLFMTGYAEEAADRAQFLAQGMDMIVKPFDLASLAAKVRSSIEH